MRINKFVAQATGLSRRAADSAIAEGRVAVNGAQPTPGQDVTDADQVTLDNQPVTPTAEILTIMLHKPVGYVVSRDGQGSNTIYDLLPPNLHHLKAIGRLDKDSSGLLLLTNDGQLANELTHPSHRKAKIYQVALDKPLTATDKAQLEHGVRVDEYTSRLHLQPLHDPTIPTNTYWQVTMNEGRNRQIRRTFIRLGYTVTSLHRTSVGDYQLGHLAPGSYKSI